jgi:hypothetical protein
MQAFHGVWRAPDVNASYLGKISADGSPCALAHLLVTLPHHFDRKLGLEVTSKNLWKEDVGFGVQERD